MRLADRVPWSWTIVLLFAASIPYAYWTPAAKPRVERRVLPPPAPQPEVFRAQPRGCKQPRCSPTFVHDLEAAVAKNQQLVRRCVVRARRAGQEMVAKIVTRVEVNREGYFTKVTLDEHTDTPLGECLLATMGSWTMAPPSCNMSARFTLHVDY